MKTQVVVNSDFQTTAPQVWNKPTPQAQVDDYINLAGAPMMQVVRRDILPSGRVYLETQPVSADSKPEIWILEPESPEKATQQQPQPEPSFEALQPQPQPEVAAQQPEPEAEPQPEPQPEPVGLKQPEPEAEQLPQQEPGVAAQQPEPELQPQPVGVAGDSVSQRLQPTEADLAEYEQGYIHGKHDARARLHAWYTSARNQYSTGYLHGYNSVSNLQQSKPATTATMDEWEEAVALMPKGYRIKNGWFHDPNSGRCNVPPSNLSSRQIDILTGAIPIR